MGTLLFFGVIAAVVIYIIAVYNRLIALKNRFKNGFAQIDVQLQRRHDLIPNLVETAKAYMSHEKETLTQVIEARNQAASAKQAAAAHPDDASAVAQLGKAESMLSGSLANFFALPILIGCGVDGGVHIVHRFRESGSAVIVTKTTAAAVTLSFLTTMIGFGALATADHRGVASLGMMMVAGLGCVLAATVLLLPALLKLLERK